MKMEKEKEKMHSKMLLKINISFSWILFSFHLYVSLLNCWIPVSNVLSLWLTISRIMSLLFFTNYFIITELRNNEFKFTFSNIYFFYRVHFALVSISLGKGNINAEMVFLFKFHSSKRLIRLSAMDGSKSTKGNWINMN